MGGLATMWRGTAFNCPGFGNKIVLSHPRFKSEGTVGQCNNGMIIGHSHNRTFDGLIFTYTSQLTICHC